MNTDERAKILSKRYSILRKAFVYAQNHLDSLYKYR